MIRLRMYGEKWRIGIEEEWEFETKEQMELILKSLIEYKDKYGRLKHGIL